MSPTMLRAEILDEGVKVLPFNVTSPTEIENTINRLYIELYGLKVCLV